MDRLFVPGQAPDHFRIFRKNAVTQFGHPLVEHGQE